jgi:hypothetical protein
MTEKRDACHNGVGNEDGQALYEMALVLMLFLVVFLGVLAVGPRIYARLAVDTAAYDCATAAVETLDPSRGRFQGITAARDTVAGFRLAPERFSVQMVAPSWQRGHPVTCIVTYDHGPSLVPFMNVLFPDAPSQTRASVSLLIATFKSRW